MSRMLCDVCGTAYPESATQCPICGCVKTASQATVEQGADQDGYTYVKGGRFSKSNVRKRAAGGAAVSVNVVRDNKKHKNQDKGPMENKGLVITALLLLVAIIVVVLYITIRFLIPPKEQPQDNGSNTVLEQVDEQEDVEETEDNENETVTATFNKGKIVFDQLEQTDKLIIDTDADMSLISVMSADEKVATAELSGGTVLVKAMGPGETTIRLLYNGNSIAECRVSCEIEFVLDIKSEITLESIGAYEDILLSVFTDEETAKIVWSSDSDIIDVENGRVVAKAAGTATVTAKYGDQEMTCTVNCKFKGDGTSTGNEDLDQSVSIGTGGGITEG